jgi:hypothetical protein
MAQLSDIIVTLKVDVHPLMKSLRKVQRKVWWMTNGTAVIIVCGFVAIGALGYLIGWNAAQ